MYIRALMYIQEYIKDMAEKQLLTGEVPERAKNPGLE